MQAVYKSAIGIVVASATILWTAGCNDDPNRPAEVDLVQTLPTAERRAAGVVNEAIRVDVVSIAGDARTSLVMRAPARVTWTVQLPLHAQFASALALVPNATGAPNGVTIRVGLSDDRAYQEIGKAEVTGSWRPFTLDLREHSEWKFSLFHQPLRKIWRLVINADATPGGTVAWDVPRLTKS